MNVSTTSLSKLISTRKEELARLLEYRGTGFPVVERQNDLRISFIELELADLEKLNKQPQLNENQQIVLEWLKGNYVQGYGAAVIRTIHLLQKENTVDISDSSYVRGAYRDLNTAEEAVVIKMFADWALEQEEE